MKLLYCSLIVTAVALSACQDAKDANNATSNLRDLKNQTYGTTTTQNPGYPDSNVNQNYGNAQTPNSYDQSLNQSSSFQSPAQQSLQGSSGSVQKNYDQGKAPVGGAGGPYSYNTKTVESFSGNISNIIRHDYPDHSGYDLQIILHTKRGDIPVILGPGQFVEDSPIDLQTMDEVKVKGSKVIIHGTTYVVAEEITTGRNTLKIRDKEGKPLWNRSGNYSSSVNGNRNSY